MSPFFSPVPLFGLPLPETELPDIRTRLRDAYLEPWTRFQPMDALRRTFALARVAGGVHQALIYQELVSSLEPRAFR